MLRHSFAPLSLRLEFRHTQPFSVVYFRPNIKRYHPKFQLGIEIKILLRRFSELFSFWINQHHFTFTITVLMSIGKHLIKVSLRQPQLVLTIIQAAVEKLPLGIRNMNNFFAFHKASGLVSDETSGCFRNSPDTSSWPVLSDCKAV